MNVYNFYINPDTNEAYVFSALLTASCQMMWQKAKMNGTITSAYYDALVANSYNGLDKPKAAYWLQL